MRYLKLVRNFFSSGNQKRIMIVAMILSAYYRACILVIKPNKLKKYWGNEGEESAADETIEVYRYAKRVSVVVNKICNHTSWESKCLVRALTAQKLLKRKKIHSTMYLGCRVDDGKMVAHAWLRCGKMFVTGGNGMAAGYAVVDKFSV